MTTSFRSQDLFGGAIVVDLPPGFVDVSTIRQVPDHQEIFLSASGFSSIIFDIAERVSHLPTDQEALQYHLNDIVDDSDSCKIWHSEPTQLPKFPPTTPIYTLLATTAPPHPSTTTATRDPSPLTPSFVALLVTLIRLVPQSTDLVLTINIPQIPDEQDSTTAAGGAAVNFEEGRFGSLVEEGVRIRERIWETLEVRDWGLFGGVGE